MKNLIILPAVVAGMFLLAGCQSEKTKVNWTTASDGTTLVTEPAPLPDPTIGVGGHIDAGTRVVQDSRVILNERHINSQDALVLTPGRQAAKGDGVTLNERHLNSNEALVFANDKQQRSTAAEMGGTAIQDPIRTLQVAHINATNEMLLRGGRNEAPSHRKSNSTINICGVSADNVSLLNQPLGDRMLYIDGGKHLVHCGDVRVKYFGDGRQPIATCKRFVSGTGDVYEFCPTGS